MKNTSHKPGEHAHATCTPRVSLASARWGRRPSAPRLVTFSWAAVAPSSLRR